ncbi:GNAT family N-acetyltransferase [Anabaena sp. WFMT]|uniref:GNAT family N-acetyltransferase n=1 Tax=Anabaena sp. WFMT TaxID=3449730 RepID=UPI003F25CECB
MKIRGETLLDYPTIAEVNTLGFKGENEARLIEKIRISDRYIPELSLVAEIDGRVIGHILYSYIDLVDEDTFQVLGLAPIAVHPQFHNQGIGSALINASLEIANTRKEAIVIVLGYPSFYTRFGFVPSVDYQIESPFPVPDDVFMVKTLQSYDKKYKGKVIYPPAFDGC